jgi:signal transduction histidine kinase
MVMADPVQLQQVILNLVVNGMDAMSNVAETSRELTVRSRSRAGCVELEVSDCGGGIPTESLQTIFESFYTTKPNGLGIGLSICRSIAEADGGRLWAENGAHGAIFHFVLPSAGQAALPVARAVGQ